ncbi:MAG: ABC transporter substrate-binding protein, partial [Chloroflexota bacterium]
GLNPIAYPGWDDVPQVLKEQAPEIIWVPIVDEGPNLEELAALEPDLILDWQTWMGADGDEANYELVSQIAPTLVSYKYPSYWQDYLRQLGELFDRSERAEEVIADYNAQIGPLRERVQAVIPSGETATTILFFGTDPWLYVPIEVYNDLAIPNSYISWLYNELGLLPSPEQLKIFNDEGWLLVSEEFYPEIQADHLVVFPGGYGGLETIDEGYHDYVERPIWKSISAVQADNVHEVVGVDIVFGYYTSLDALKTFADAVEE